MILELDIGNTQAKWRILGAAGVIRVQGRGDVAEWGSGKLPAAWNDSIERVRIASVRRAEVLEPLLVWLQRWTGVRPEVASAGAMCAGVSNGYTAPASLGVDRWLAMVAAFVEIKGPVLVADIGSALTIDLVDALGCHRGGYIIPGPRLMQEVLIQSTDRIRYDSGGESSPSEFGRSTAICVLNGAALAMVGAIQAARDNAAQLLGIVPTLVLAGGYAGELVRMPQFVAAKHRPDLVLDGLGLVLP